MATKAGVKLDQGKVPVVTHCFHYFPRALLEVAKVSEFGAKKYTRGGWKTVANGEERYLDALGRHLLNEIIEGPRDAESECLHAAQDAWNALARLELILCAQETKKEEKPASESLPSDPEGSLVPLLAASVRVKKLERQRREGEKEEHKPCYHTDPTTGQYYCCMCEGLECGL